MTSQNPPVEIQQVDSLALDVCHFRGRPLLVLYYHEFAGEMREDDVTDICAEIRRNGYSLEHKLSNLDVLLHTMEETLMRATE
jgi:hypothetical protein